MEWCSFEFHLEVVLVVRSQIWQNQIAQKNAAGQVGGLCESVGLLFAEHALELFPVLVIEFEGVLVACG